MSSFKKINFPESFCRMSSVTWRSGNYTQANFETSRNNSRLSCSSLVASTHKKSIYKKITQQNYFSSSNPSTKLWFTMILLAAGFAFPNLRWLARLRTVAPNSTRPRPELVLGFILHHLTPSNYVFCTGSVDMLFPSVRRNSCPGRVINMENYFNFV